MPTNGRLDPRRAAELYQDPRWGRCWRKVAYRSRAAAEQAIAKHAGRPLRFGGDVQIYECRTKLKGMKGTHYHLGHKPRNL